MVDTPPAADCPEENCPLLVRTDNSCRLSLNLVRSDDHELQFDEKQWRGSGEVSSNNLAVVGPRQPSRALSHRVARISGRLARCSGTRQQLVDHFSATRYQMPKPAYDEVVEIKEFNPPRATDKPVSADRYGSFVRSTAYEGWRRSLFALEWFDSRTERTVANIVDTDDGVTCWVRLHTGELPILWSSGGQQYNPDFIVLETDGTHWVVEVKMNKEMTSADVLGKREAAMRWANTVTANECVSVIWRYLLVSESDIDDAKGSWPALKKLGS
jgi:type III restriction enzyme